MPGTEPIAQGACDSKGVRRTDWGAVPSSPGAPPPEPHEGVRSVICLCGEQSNRSCNFSGSSSYRTDSHWEWFSRESRHFHSSPVNSIPLQWEMGFQSVGLGCFLKLPWETDGEGTVTSHAPSALSSLDICPLKAFMRNLFSRMDPRCPSPLGRGRSQLQDCPHNKGARTPLWPVCYQTELSFKSCIAMSCLTLACSISSAETVRLRKVTEPVSQFPSQRRVFQSLR